MQGETEAQSRRTISTTTIALPPIITYLEATQVLSSPRGGFLFNVAARKPLSQISIELFMSKEELNLFITSIESIYFSHCGRIATDNSPLFILLAQGLEGCPLACISALLFVFSTRVDESTDWQSDGTLDDSTKPWPGLAVQLFTERPRKGKKEKGERGCLCV